MGPPRRSSLAWHNYRQLLAVSDGGNNVQLFDLSATVRPASDANDLATPAAAETLQTDEQRQVDGQMLERSPRLP